VADIDTNILETLYLKHAKKVYLYLFSLCHQRTLAEDLMQETFLKAILSLQDSGEEILPWLFRVAKNLFLDECKKRKRIVSDEIEDLNLTDGNDLLTRLIQNEQNRRLFLAVNRLPLREREIVVMYYFGECKQESIAKYLGVSPGSVRVILHRTKIRLRKELETQED